MKKHVAAIVAGAAAILFTLAMPAAAADRTGDSTHVAGEKLDSGLGELPHYSKWTDPTGRNPVHARATAETPPAAAVKREAKRPQPQPVQVSMAK